MANKIRGASGLTGGAVGALDSIDGSLLNDGDLAVVLASDDQAYFYTLDADSGATEASPRIISPDTNAGNKRWIRIGPKIDRLTNYADLNTAITAIGATEQTLILDKPTTLTANATIPTTLHVIGMRNCQIDGSYTITINGPFEAGSYQVFGSSITVSFGSGAIEEGYAEWWQENTTPGTTDMYTAIQAAVTAFQGKGIKLKGLGTTYYVSTDDDIDISEPIIIEGSGWNTVYKNGRDQIMFLAQDLTTEQTGLVFRDFAINGNSRGQYNAGVIQINGFAGFLVDHVYVYGADRTDGSNGVNGINFSDGGGAAVSRGTVQNCFIDGCSKAGIYGATADGGRGLIIGNTVRDCTGIGGAPGIQVKGQYCRVIGNEVYSNEGDGIHITPTAAAAAQGIIIANNECYSNGDGGSNTGAGIYLGNAESQPGHFPIITGNFCYGNDGHGIEIQLTNGIIITSNQSRNNNYQGIKVDRTNDAIISNNECLNNNQSGAANSAGIVIDGGAGAYSNFQILGNLCTDDQGTATQDYGLRFEAGTLTKVTVKDNNFGGNADGPILFTVTPELQAEQETIYIGTLAAATDEEHAVHVSPGPTGSVLYDVLLIDRTGVAVDAADTRIFDLEDGDGNSISDINTDSGDDNVALGANTAVSMADTDNFSSTHRVLVRDEVATLDITHGGNGKALTNFKAVVQYITY